MQNRVLTNGRVLIDGRFVSGANVLVSGGRIRSLAADLDELTADTEIDDLDGRLLLPGFIDLQVNGGGGVLFNDKPTVAGIEAIAEAHRRFGTTGFLPTLISDELTVVDQAMAAVRDAISTGVPGVLGIHVEGPFLNERRRGIHDRQKLRHLTRAVLDELVPLPNGKTVLTVAPESVEPGIIRKLVDKGFIVCAGHSNARYAEMCAALDEGITGFTHLFNAMSALEVREPGVVGAALDSRDSWCGIIADGHHVSPVVLRIAYRCKPPDKLILVSDAMPPVGSEIEEFSLLDKTITVRDGVCRDEDGTLAGAVLNMADAVRNMMDFAGIELATSVELATCNPASFLGLDEETGRIEVGKRADLVVADEQLRVQCTYVGGQPFAVPDTCACRSTSDAD